MAHWNAWEGHTSVHMKVGRFELMELVEPGEHWNPWLETPGTAAALETRGYSNHSGA